VFREIINTVETRPISPKGVFCSGVYYTRDDTYKDCYVQQGCSQQGAFHTSTERETSCRREMGTGENEVGELTTARKACHL
jgi:hypothetical protein